ncbi:MAG: aminodeoxychorismate/anthranilate synthase component II [Deltaproteobacteria bacterium]|nr:aminodeoxychorismate/anthranilate synthase component II [Deltaproteobacteria bacterium]
MRPVRVLLFDCRDSFTRNLAQMTEEMLPAGSVLEVASCDGFDPGRAVLFDRVILSPGPGLPEETPGLFRLIETAVGASPAPVPVLGVCLGHQALAAKFGARLLNLPEVCHGMSSRITLVSPDKLFRGLPQTFEAGRYHSWLVSDDGLPEDLLVTAVDELGRIMGLRHRRLPVHGVQFHPESILTPFGPQIIGNFLFGL